MEGLFVLLSIHPSQQDDSPYGYTGHVTRYIKCSGIFVMAAILVALRYVHFATKHKICGVNSHK